MLIDDTADLPGSEAINFKPEPLPRLAPMPHPLSETVRRLAVAYTPDQANSDPAVAIAKCMLDAVHGSFIQNKPERPIDTQFQFIAPEVDINLVD